MSDSQSSGTPANTETLNSVEIRQAELAREFAALGDWEERYKRVIDYGRKLAPYPEQYREEKFKVRGCQSQVWLHASVGADQRIELYADSDALIVRGLVALLVFVYSGSRPSDILSASPQFLKDLGFEAHLSPSRANGLYAMLKQILSYATVFKALERAGGS